MLAQYILISYLYEVFATLGTGYNVRSTLDHVTLYNYYSLYIILYWRHFFNPSSHSATLNPRVLSVPSACVPSVRVPSVHVPSV